MPDRAWMRAVPYALVLLFSVLFFSPVLMKNRPIIVGDYFTFNVPNRVYATDRMRDGDLPQWTNAIMGGFPFICDPQPGTFFPPNLLLSACFRDVGNSFVMDRFYILQCAALALGGVFLARSFNLGAIAAVAAGIFTLTNGYIIMHFGHMNVVQGIVAGVWAFGMAVRAFRKQSLTWAFASALAMSCTVTAGHPQVPLHAFYAAAIACLVYIATLTLRTRNWSIVRRAIQIAAIILIFGFLAGAMQTLPSLNITRISNRSALNVEDVMIMETPPAQLPGFLMPGLYQPLLWRVPSGAWFNIVWKTWGVIGAWEHTYPIGIVAFGLGVLGVVANLRRRLVWFLLISCAFLLFAAIGSRGYIYPLLYHFAPGFKQVRIPPRLLWLFMCAWAVLAGLGVQTLVRGYSRRIAWSAVLIPAVMAIAGASVLAAKRITEGSWFKAFEQLFVLTPYDVTGWRTAPEFTTDILLQVALTASLLAILIGAILLTPRKGSRASAVLVTALLTFELGLYGFHRNISTRHPHHESIRVPELNAVPLDGDGRVTKVDYRIYYRTNGAFGYGEQVEDLQGYNPIAIKWVHPFRPNSLYPRGEMDEKLLDMWNVRYVSRERRLIPATLNGNKTQLVEANRISISQQEDYRPFAEWKMDTATSATRLELFSTSEHSQDRAQEATAAVVSVIAGDGTETTFPLRYGKEIADWTHGSRSLPPVTGHTKPPVGYVLPLDGLAYANGAFYGASYDFETTISVAKVRVQTTQPSPTAVHIGAMRLVTETGYRPLMPEEALGYRLLPKKEGPWEVLERPAPYGDVWMVPAARPVSYKKEMQYVKAALREDDLQRTVLVNKRQVSTETLPAMSATREDFAGTASITRRKPEHIFVDTQSNDNGWVVLSHTWVPGWTAKLDGNPVDIIQANGPHMTVPVPAGKHRLEFRYTTPGLVAGLTISGFAWLISLAAIGRGIIRRGKRRPMAEI